MTRPTIDELEMLNPEQLRLLLDIEIWDDSPNIQFIQDLIVVGCPVDVRNEWGRTPLHFAARYEKLEVAELLLSKGADINARANEGRTPLHWAALWGQLDMAKFLVSRGAQVDARDDNNRTAWDISSKEIREDVPELEPK